MNVAELLDSLGVEYLDGKGHVHATPGWLQVRHAPCCGTNTWRLGVNAKTRVFNCWSCGKQRGGEMLSALADIHMGEAIRLLGEAETDYVGKREERKKGKLVLPDGLGRLLPAHRDYLWRRRIDPDEAEEVWGVRGIGPGKKLSWRIWLPVIFGGETVSWTTRTIGDRGPRYINARPDEELWPHKDFLFGEDYCTGSVLVVEGGLDVLRFGKGCAATMGVAYTSAQVRRIGRFVRRVICFDAEYQAQRKARELAADLAVYPGTTLVVETDSKDVGAMEEDELEELRRVVG